MSDLQALIENYYSAWFRFHPETAVELGVDGYSHLLTPCEENDIGALVSLNEKLLSSLDEMNVEGLTAAQQLDVELMRAAALLEIEWLNEHDWRFRQPGRFLPINAIYQLTIRKVNEPQKAMAARLAAIPAYLREARTLLQGSAELIPPLWLDSAVTEARHGSEYFRSLRQHPKISQYRLNAELEKAAQAVEQFADYLDRELRPRAAGDFACGRRSFERLLQYRHGLAVDAEQLHQFGKNLYDRTLAELTEETTRLQGDDDIQALNKKISHNHPSASELLPHYRQGMESAFDFVKANALVTIPAEQKLSVVETPAFLRHEIPFAAYMEPSSNDAQQCGYYYVTPAEDDAALGEHNVISLEHTCVHEAWPGHHLQFVTANLNSVACTLPRLTNPSATLYEGWALYCEQLMQEQGFLDAAESRFVLLKDRLWRALRVMLDVELHTRGLDIDSAVRKMQDALGFSREQALAELTWYSQAPTVPMGYATGWALITAIRERLQGMDEPFELKQFHDKLLAEGSVALPYVLQSQFGEPLWQSVSRATFATH